MEKFKNLARRAAAIAAPALVVFNAAAGITRPAIADPAGPTAHVTSILAAAPARYSNFDYSPLGTDPETFQIELKIFGDLVNSDMRGLRTGTSIPNNDFVNQPYSDQVVVDDFRKWPLLTAQLHSLTSDIRSGYLALAQQREYDAEESSIVTVNADYRDSVPRALYNSGNYNLETVLRNGTVTVDIGSGNKPYPVLTMIKRGYDHIIHDAKINGRSGTAEIAFRVQNVYTADDFQKSAFSGLLMASGNGNLLPSGLVRQTSIVSP